MPKDLYEQLLDIEAALNQTRNNARTKAMPLEYRERCRKLIEAATVCILAAMDIAAETRDADE